MILMILIFLYWVIGKKFRFLLTGAMLLNQLLDQLISQQSISNRSATSQDTELEKS